MGRRESSAIGRERERDNSMARGGRRDKIWNILFLAGPSLLPLLRLCTFFSVVDN